MGLWLYLVRPISYKGLKREEPLEYPEPALREAILNAIIHKDYSDTYIFLRVYPNKLTLFNPGGLPELKEHGSITNERCQEIVSISKRTATRDLQILLDKQLIQKVGTTGKGTSYILGRGAKDP